MLKLNFRSLFLVLGVIILLLVSVACGSAEENTLDNKENVQSNEDQQMIDGEISELCMKLSTNMAIEDEKSGFCAESYIQSPQLSWVYSLDVKIEDGKILINDVLYEEASATPPSVLYSDSFLACADGKGVTSVLEKIQNCESCYLLEAQGDGKTGQIISVYEIDNAYYFVRFFDNGEVMRIHRASIQ